MMTSIVNLVVRRHKYNYIFFVNTDSVLHTWSSSKIAFRKIGSLWKKFVHRIIWGPDQGPQILFETFLIMVNTRQ
jgi:hypothetical protein